MERKDEIEEGVVLPAICRVFFIAWRYAKLGVRIVRVQTVQGARS